MGVCFLYGSGGSQLEYTVKGGLSRPANPKPGDIWVETDTPVYAANITSEQAPVPVWDAEEGYVYITTGTFWNKGTSADFDRRQNYYLFLYPATCVQEIGGKWVRKNAYVYNDTGEWHQFSSTQYAIFNAGGATDYSGGWNAYAYKSQSSGSTPKAPTFTLGSTIDISLYGQYVYNMGTVFSEAAIDLTKYSTLVIEVASTQTGGEDGGFSCSVCAAKQNNWTPVATATNVGAGTHSIDISSLSGSYYLSLSLGGVGQGHTAKAVINQIILK